MECQIIYHNFTNLQHFSITKRSHFLVTIVTDFPKIGCEPLIDLTIQNNTIKIISSTFFWKTDVFYATEVYPIGNTLWWHCVYLETIDKNSTRKKKAIFLGFMA
jgi:hypothetical protein